MLNIIYKNIHNIGIYIESISIPEIKNNNFSLLSNQNVYILVTILWYNYSYYIPII